MDEASRQRTNRNWEELLQELRVTQTGIQILTGFLLTVPFSARFTALTPLQRASYLAVLVGSVIATTLIVAPVAFHRVLFRRQRRPWLVTAANQCARGGLLTMALTICGAVFLAFDMATTTTTAIVVSSSLLALVTCVWLLLPVLVSRTRNQ